MALGALLAGQDAGLEAGLETLKSLLSICKTCSLLMEDTQLATGTQPPEVFYSSDNTSGCIVLPILPYEAEVVRPYQCYVQSMCWNRDVQELQNALTSSSYWAKLLPALLYPTQRQAGGMRPPLANVAHFHALRWPIKPALH